MPISQMLWPDVDGGLPNASDIHVVRGAPSPNLLERLQVITGSSTMPAATYLLTHTDVTFEFRPLFRGDPLPADKTKYQGLGVRVDVTTGVVEIRPELTGFTPFNFVMEITAKNNGITAAERTVRVQAHGAVQRVWLTPDPLTVRRPPPLRPGEAGDPRDTHMRFVVRALFDDKVIGDLTLEDGTEWTPGTHVNGEGRLLVNPTDAPGTLIAVTATLDARFGGPAPGNLWSSSALMRVEKGWHELSPAERPVIELLSQSGFPKKLTPETQMPNVLLMTDGWGISGDPTKFEGLTTKIMSTLRTSRLLRPFTHLVDSMCFWAWFVPSPKRGFSVVCEVRTLEDDGKLYAEALPSALPPLPKSNLTLQNLLYVVGLPLPDEKRSAEELRQHWKETCTDFEDSLVSTNVIDRWSELRTRTFVDCVDTEFHTGLEGLPGIESLRAEAFDFPNVFRGRENLANAMAVLVTKKSTLFGGLSVAELWSDPKNFPPAVLRFDNRDFVVCFVPIPGVRSHSGLPVMVNSRNDRSWFRVQPIADPNRAGHDLIAEEPVPADLGSVVRTFTHELTHQFALGDEYAETFGKHPDNATVLNLISDNEVLDPNTKAILFDRIRWNWHRATAAALIESSITVQDNLHYAIKVHPGHARQFNKLDPVLLRLREYRGKLGSVASKVMKFELHVDRIVADDELVVSPSNNILSSELLTLLAELPDFKEGSVLFRPIPAVQANFDKDYPYMHLITPQIRNLLKKGALWAKGCDSTNHSDTQYPDLPGAIPTFLLGCLKNSWRVVGLYQGGGRYTCGVYHPAGWCLMRNTHDDATELCAVCRYVLTDIIDPSLHNATDAMFREIYNV
jgi:hypothetical protein